MSLPLAWVDRIFEKLTLIYGQQFLGRWRDVDLDAVKNDWACELAVFERYPQAIAFALDNLDAEKPPTVLQFRNTASRAPNIEPTRLDKPEADLVRVTAEFAKLASKREEWKNNSVGRLDWAYRLKEKDAKFPKLVSPTIRKMYCEALS